MTQTIDIKGESNHAAKTVYSDVSDIVSDVTGWNVNLLETLAGPDNTGITLDMSEGVDNLIRDGRFPFTLERHLDGHFGESTGSSNVTSVRIDRGWNLRETIETLSVTGQLQDARDIVEKFRAEDDPDSETITAYAIGQYAKGWIAEEIIQSMDWAKKGSVSQDEGGIDFYVNGEPVQVGSITRYNSRMTEIEGSDRTHLLYQWDHEGNLHVGTPDGIMKANKEIAKSAGLSSTLTKRSHGGLKINERLGRSFRYLWW
jgi:hypothetical protein